VNPDALQRGLLHGHEQKVVTNTVAADEAATEVNAAEPSASDSASEPTKPAGRPAAPRPVVRDSLKVGEQLREVPHRGNGDRTITRTAAAGDEAGGGQILLGGWCRTGSFVR